MDLGTVAGEKRNESEVEVSAVPTAVACVEWTEAPSFGESLKGPPTGLLFPQVSSFPAVFTLPRSAATALYTVKSVYRNRLTFQRANPAGPTHHRRSVMGGPQTPLPFPTGPGPQVDSS